MPQAARPHWEFQVQMRRWCHKSRSLRVIQSWSWCPGDVSNKGLGGVQNQGITTSAPGPLNNLAVLSRVHRYHPSQGFPRSRQGVPEHRFLPQKLPIFTLKCSPKRPQNDTMSHHRTPSTITSTKHCYLMPSDMCLMNAASSKTMKNLRFFIDFGMSALR